MAVELTLRIKQLSRRHRIYIFIHDKCIANYTKAGRRVGGN